MLLVGNLHYQYGAQTVLNDASFRLPPNQVGLLVGKNGAGKSTLLRCIAGWTLIRAGEVTVNGESIHGQNEAFYRQVVFVPDTPDFYDELTAWEHLQFIAKLNRIPDWEIRGKQLLHQLDLSEHVDAFPFTFSRGMRYKLALSMALLVRPPLLLLDEPFGPLDAVASQMLWQLLRHHAEHFGSVLLSGHTVAANRNPDIVFHLRGGQIETIQQPADIDLMNLLSNVD
jgi:ABC-2 type transport system ATP-binding protein